MASMGEHGSDGYVGGRRRPSPAVFRRRRLMAAVLGLLLVVALAVGVLALTGTLRPGGDQGAQAATSTVSGTPAPASSSAEPPADPTPAPSASAPATPTPAPSDPAPSDPATPTPAPSATASATAPPAAGCDDAVVIVAETDQPAYAPGEDPVLSLLVRNGSGEECEVNVGTSQMEFVLTSDNDRVFSSIDCQADSQDLQRTIPAGGEERATFTWDRNRTVPDCTVVDEEPAAGEYTLTTRLGGRSSEPVEFTLQE